MGAELDQRILLLERRPFLRHQSPKNIPTLLFFTSREVNFAQGHGSHAGCLPWRRPVQQRLSIDLCRRRAC